MTTQIVVPTISREFAEDMFSDLTTSDFRTDRNEVEEYIFTFADDLDEATVKAIRLRCDLTPQQENVRKRALTAADNMQSIIDFQGTMTTAQLNAAVKTLATTLQGVVKVLYNQVN